MSFFVIRYFCIFNSRFLSFLSMFKKYGNKHWKKVFSSTVNKVSATEIIFLRNIEQSIFVENIEKKGFSEILKSVGVAEFALTLPPPWQHLVAPSRIIHMLCNSHYNYTSWQHIKHNTGNTSNTTSVQTTPIQQADLFNPNPCSKKI